MELRSDAEVRESFERAAAVLDEAMRLAQSITGVRFLDHSNRSGFDHSGFLHFRYEVELEHRRGEDTIERASVTIAFLEPTLAGEQSDIRLRWRSERFHAGSSVQLFERSGSVALPEPLVATDVARVVIDSVEAARRLLGG